MMDAAWNTPFLDELGLFDEGEHDDQVDALSGAFIALDREQTQQSHWKVRQH